MGSPGHSDDSEASLPALGQGIRGSSRSIESDGYHGHGRPAGSPIPVWGSCHFVGIHIRESDLSFEQNPNLGASVKAPDLTCSPEVIKSTLSCAAPDDFNKFTPGFHMNTWPDLNTVFVLFLFSVEIEA